MPTAEESQELRELTRQDLRGVRLEGGRIDAYALIGRAVGATKCKRQQCILANCLQKCPELNKHWTKCHFKRMTQYPALTAEGAYLLILTLGEDLTTIETLALSSANT